MGAVGFDVGGALPQHGVVVEICVGGALAVGAGVVVEFGVGKRLSLEHRCCRNRCRGSACGSNGCCGQLTTAVGGALVVGVGSVVGFAVGGALSLEWVLWSESV